MSILLLSSTVASRFCNLLIMLAYVDIRNIVRNQEHFYSVSGLSCPEEEAYLTVIFHSFLHNNNINSDYILGANIIFTPHSNFSSYF